jgi:hypothetical protein
VAEALPPVDLGPVWESWGVVFDEWSIAGMFGFVGGIGYNLMFEKEGMSCMMRNSTDSVSYIPSKLVRDILGE